MTINIFFTYVYTDFETKQAQTGQSRNCDLLMGGCEFEMQSHCSWKVDIYYTLWLFQ